MGAGAEAVISDSDLALVGNMGSRSGDELRAFHPLGLSDFFPVPVGDSAFPFIQGEALQGQQRPGHILSHPLSLSFCPAPDAAMDIKAGVAPGEEADERQPKVPPRNNFIIIIRKIA
jgi:hypothetical protein